MPQPSSTGLFFGPEGLLQRHAAGLVIAALAGAGGGAATVALLALINQTLHRPDGAAAGLALAFLGLAVLTLAGRALADALTNRIGQDVVRGLRLTLARRILAAPIDELERFRTHRLIPVLSHDVSTVSGLCLSLPYTVVSALVVLGCLLWLVWLSWQLALLLVVVVALAIVIHGLALQRAQQGFEAAREGEDKLQKAWHTLGDAAKELRLSRGRRRQLYIDAIHGHVDDIRSVNVREARPIMVFDEWAADQDPSFRHRFYTELLPELRAQGHTLVVISHDDRYFALADRVVAYRDGKLPGAMTIAFSPGDNACRKSD